MSGKIEAFFREFPFLQELFTQHGKERVRSVRVSRIDHEFLERRVSLEVFPLFGDVVQGSAESELLLVLDQDGKTLVQVGIKELSKSSWWKRLWGCPGGYWEFPESIGEAIMRCDGQRHAHYVVSFRKGDLVLYKPPKGSTIQNWVEEQTKREREVIHTEVEKIDAEAQSHRQ